MFLICLSTMILVPPPAFGSSRGVLQQALFFLEGEEPEKAFDVLASQEVSLKGLSHYWSLRATARFRMGELEGAAEDFQRGLTLDPENADLWRNLGWTFHGMDRWKDGAEAFQRALTVSQQGKDAYGLALCLFNAGDAVAAKEKMAEWLKADTPPDWLRLFVHASLASGDTKPELLRQMEGLALESGRAEDWRLLASGLHRAGYAGRAALALETAFYLKKPDHGDWQALAGLYASAGLPHLAAGAMERAGRDAMDGVPYLMAAGRYRDALLLLQKNEGPEAGMLAARLHRQAGNPSAALASLSGLKETPEVLYMKGLCFRELSRYSEARRVFALLAEVPGWEFRVKGLLNRMQALDEAGMGDSY
ncbi:tetratricopeptide repeat protein [Desulfobotulus alkaliphilus]|uniref:tetratricopeptide repeat protein n=1 Tax=Desulfobotulus alkaliphilus TaxID=622671 RepID=UPI001C94BF50|nr:tetratricopeptide repeat protein [Desulfobotulus alkaliphilus]